MHDLLSHHEDCSKNFYSDLMIATEGRNGTLANLRRHIEVLLDGNGEMALFYFSGHGHLSEDTDRIAYLVPQDAKDRNSEMLEMRWLLHKAQNSKMREVVIILDCCHSGQMGNGWETTDFTKAELRTGITILTASLHSQLAKETTEGGVFTRILVNGLMGAAADLLGNVTAASLYSHADLILGPREQRPQLKCHLTQMSPLRKCAPKVPPGTLRQLPTLFPSKEALHRLQPGHEETSPLPDPELVKTFGLLRSLERAGLVECVSERAMYWEALRNGACRLTGQGHFFWDMAKKGEFGKP
jgi:hypothetical protein